MDVSLDSIKPRILKRYRRAFNDMDSDGRGSINLSQLGSVEDLEGLIGNASNQINFEDFARLLHRAETAGAGRTLITLLESTEEGQNLVDTIAKYKKSQKSTAKKGDAVVTVREEIPMPAEILQVWQDSSPMGDDTSVERVRDSLVRAQNQGTLLVDDEDLLLLIQDMQLASPDGITVTLEIFWNTLLPLVQHGAEDNLVLSSTMSSVQDSMMSSGMSRMEHLMNDSEVQTYRTTFNALDTFDDKIQQMVLSHDLHALLTNEQMDMKEKMYFFQFTNLVDTCGLDEIDFDTFIHLAKQAEDSTNRDMGTTSISSGILRRLVHN